MAVDTLPITEACNYEKVKGMILSTLNISEGTYRVRMRDTRYDQEKRARWLASLIRSHGMRWLKPQERAMEEVVELVWLEQFVSVLPPAAQTWVLRHPPRPWKRRWGLWSYEAAERINPKVSDQKGEIWKGVGP